MTRCTPRRRTKLSCDGDELVGQVAIELQHAQRGDRPVARAALLADGGDQVFRAESRRFVQG